MRNASLARPVPAHAAPLDAARAIEADIFARAGAVDDGALSLTDDIAALAGAGLLTAPLPAAAGGQGLGLDAATADAARAVLTTIGRASLTIGRLFEGHLNAVKLAVRYGAPPAVAILAAEARAGRLSGVWNAARGPGLRAVRGDGGWHLLGGKIHCSGAGLVRRPLVTAAIDGADGPLMLLPDLTDAAARIDLSVWRANGMRATATGTVDFTGMVVPDAAVIGDPGDYYRAPLFAGGAWRVLAVQLGGFARIMALHADRLRAAARDRDPVMRARFAHAAGTFEAARLLVREAAMRAEGDGDPETIEAYVNLARSAFEGHALTGIDAARRNIGLSTFIAPEPLDRVLRDLETYLRQPFVDASRDAAAGWLLDHGGTFA